jgi:hypothetical protein
MRFPGVCARTHANIPGQPQIARPHQPGLHVMKSKPCSTALLQYTIEYACKHHMYSRSIDEHSEDCGTAHVPANQTQLERTLYMVARTNTDHCDVLRAAQSCCWPTFTHSATLEHRRVQISHERNHLVRNHQCAMAYRGVNNSCSERD